MLKISTLHGHSCMKSSQMRLQPLCEYDTVNILNCDLSFLSNMLRNTPEGVEERETDHHKVINITSFSTQQLYLHVFAETASCLYAMLCFICGS